MATTNRANPATARLARLAAADLAAARRDRDAAERRMIDAGRSDMSVRDYDAVRMAWIRADAHVGVVLSRPLSYYRGR